MSTHTPEQVEEAAARARQFRRENAPELYAGPPLSSIERNVTNQIAGLLWDLGCNYLRAEQLVRRAVDITFFRRDTGEEL